MNDKKINISGALKEGWELTKINIGFLVVYQLIWIFLAWLFIDHEDYTRIGLIQIIGVIILTLGKIGYYNSSLLLTKGLKPSFDQFYKNWRVFFSWIIAGFIFGLMFSIGLSLFIFPGLYVLATFGFFPFFIIDKGSGPIEALEKSAEATKGMRMELLLFFLACAGIDALGVLFFGVGILIASPVTLIAMASVYEKITGQMATSIQPDDIL